MRTRATAANPALLAIKAVGPVIGAQLLITAGDNPDRLRSEASFAALCAAAPVPVSSGRTDRYRLSRGGDRAANSALHLIVNNRMSNDPRTRTYRDERLAKGWTKKAVYRALKRAVAREVFRALTSRCEVPDYSDLRPARHAKNLTLSAAATHLGVCGPRRSPKSNEDTAATTFSPTPTEPGSPPLDISRSISAARTRNRDLAATGAGAGASGGRCAGGGRPRCRWCARRVCSPLAVEPFAACLGVPLMRVVLFTRLVSLVADDPGVTANTTGLPGLVQLRSIVGGMLTFGLVACVAALVASAVTWGFGSNSGNPHLAGRGKTGVVVSAGAALLIGAANAIVAFFSAAGGSL